MKKSNVIAGITLLVLGVALVVPAFSTTFQSYVGSTATLIYMPVCLVLFLAVSRSMD